MIMYLAEKVADEKALSRYLTIWPVFAHVKGKLQMTNTCAHSSLWLFWRDTSFFLPFSHKDSRKISKVWCSVWVSTPDQLLNCWCGCNLPCQTKFWKSELGILFFSLCLFSYDWKVLKIFHEDGWTKNKQESILTFEI